MGAWDYGALDNDPALEVLDRWQAWVDDPAAIGYEAAIDQYFKYWGDAVGYGDSITNMEVIALAAIHFNRELRVPARLRKATVDALNRELVPDELNSWANPARREEVLLRMLAELGGKRTRPRRPKMINDPAVQFRSIGSARAELIGLAKAVTGEVKQLGYLGFSQSMMGESVDVPPFIRTLHRFMNHRIWEKDWNISSHAHHERRMMLAWYTTLANGGSVEDVANALDGCHFP
jgi:hypothetical protein